MSITSEWNAKQKRLREIIRKPDCYQEAQSLFLQMHASVHGKGMSGSASPTILDHLYEGLTRRDFSIMPGEKDVTIAWDIWHITRIEDLTVNILVNESQQVFSDHWRLKLKTTITDTGNAMSDDEIMAFSKAVDVESLMEYRLAVGMQTRRILGDLTYGEMKRKIDKQRLSMIREEGGVLNHPDSLWLLDFWGKKDVAGIILMPVTRHQIVHINDGFHLKQAIRRQKNFFMS